MPFANRADHTINHRARYRRPLVWVVSLAVLAAVIRIALVPGGGVVLSDYTTIPARRGPLEISVVTGGTVKALQSQQVICDVESWQGGGRKILNIVDEGRYVSQEDVENGLVLVELDSADIKRQLTTMEIAFQGTEAALSDAQQAYDIQLNQSSSDIYTAEIRLQFAQLDMEKYLGEEVMTEILAPLKTLEIELGMDLDDKEITLGTQTAVPDEIPQTAPDFSKDDDSRKARAASLKAMLPPPGSKPIATDSPEGPNSAEQDSSNNTQGQFPSGALTITTETSDTMLSLLRQQHPDVNFSQYAVPVLLGKGEANQRIRQLEDALIVARRELGQAKVKLTGKERLEKKGFVTAMELENDRLDMEKKDIGVKSAEASLALFKEYEFPKQAQKLLSDYLQARSALGRTEKKAISDITGARARRLAAEAQYRMETEEIDRLKQMIAKCTMRATGTGLVVYGGEEEKWWNQQPIRKGATVHEQQTIITIPDTTKMSVKVKIHEAEVTKVAIGQNVRISVGAHPDKKLTGVVTRVAVLPSSQDEFLNPDFKVYETVIEIDGSHDWLKPGMSGRAEIVVENLNDVLYIPIQSAVPQAAQEVCFVLGANGPQRRDITTGATNIEYIVVTKGLEEGENVLLRPPDGSRQDEPSDERDDRFNEESAVFLPSSQGKPKDEAGSYDEGMSTDAQ